MCSFTIKRERSGLKTYGEEISLFSVSTLYNCNFLSEQLKKKHAELCCKYTQ